MTKLKEVLKEEGVATLDDQVLLRKAKTAKKKLADEAGNSKSAAWKRWAMEESSFTVKIPVKRSRLQGKK
jgi:hypothetical protein